VLDLIIVGAGGFGREMYHWAKDCFPADRYRFKGFLSAKPTDLDGFAIDAPILGDPMVYEPQPNDRFVFAIGLIDVKRRLIDALAAKGAQFERLIHPTAIVCPTAQLGTGVVICPFVTVSDSVRVDDHAMLNFYASCGHDAHVGAYSVLCPYATLNGFAVIEEEVFLGTHTTVTPSRRVGHHSKVSANSMVSHNAPPYSLIYGVPGQMKRLFNAPQE
jgi:sugar O-acyltransferase (sialic acid O-acetyltransferase NeuD family)